MEALEYIKRLVTFVYFNCTIESKNRYLKTYLSTGQSKRFLQNIKIAKS